MAKRKIISEKVAVTLRRADGRKFECLWVAVPSLKADHVDIMPFEHGSSSVFTIHRKQLNNALTGIPVIIEEQGTRHVVKG